MKTRVTTEQWWLVSFKVKGKRVSDLHMYAIQSKLLFLATFFQSVYIGEAINSLLVS